MSNLIETQEILTLMPHRYPFALLDRVLDWSQNDTIHGIKNVTLNEPFFQGHFPENPVMPGVLMIEAMAQAAGILAKKSQPELFEGKLIVLAGIDNVRFKRIVRPGDTLDIHMKATVTRSKVWKFSGRVEVAGELACQADIIVVAS